MIFFQLADLKELLIYVLLTLTNIFSYKSTHECSNISASILINFLFLNFDNEEFALFSTKRAALIGASSENISDNI